VRPGDTLERIFRRVGVNPADAYLSSRQDEAQVLNHLRPGKTLTVAATEDGHLQRLEYEIDLATRLRLQRTPGTDRFTVERKTRQFETRLRYVSGTINSSLFDAGQQAGLSDSIIMQLVEIFGWDIDFVLDLREQDGFTVVYEEQYWRGEKVADGAVVAAEFVNRGNRYRALRHVDDDGRAQYYSPQGENMRKAFLRTPVEFSRISSRFGRRHHPVLNRMRMHKGVDYAAPAGTPVRATADGRIVLRGRKGGYGNAVVIRHGGSYSTLYAHLSRFKSGQHTGDRVRQGDVIGYVGSTGLATGPHLHYEFRVNGAHANPLNFKQPKAEPIPAKYRSEFLQQAAVWQTRLDLVARREDVRVASAQ
jgi:murein DD-endopeptidase MepM/ murein hydrolase activator NlpD